ncbi:RHS repeat-associated core domain-containing protein [Sphingomonas sp. LR61]|uniref:RHS repeat-associated core domain-containing protein n=1 Tax=Sphingomonas sp. LR61 TaxID=3050234 RepID=UPI002FE3EB41
MALTGSGGMSVAGLEWLGARVYDPAARGFLSVDPLAPILGAAWSGNPYSYAGNDPLQAVDPLGLRPATDKDLQAYRDASQGAIANVRDWADEHSELISNIAIGVGIAATVLAMCTPLGPVVAIAVMAGGGAALAGGMSIKSNRGKDGKVDWGAVGVDALIGGVAGAVGGGTSLGLSKAVPALGRSSISWVARAGGSRVLGEAGRSAISSGVQNATSNMADYGVKTGWQGDAGGYLQAGGVGMATGTAFSAVSSASAPKLGSMLASRLNLDDVAGSTGRHANLEGVSTATQAASAVVSKGVDSAVGGFQSVVNEIARPGGDASGANLSRSFWSGVVGGAEGPDVHSPTARHRG